jgi:integrase
VFRRASDGRWVGRVDVGHVEGKRKRVTVYGSTEREVLGKLREVVRAKERGQDLTARPRTVAEWLTEWLDEVIATDGTRPLTLRSYRMLARQHIVPYLGSVRLDKLGPADVRGMVAGLTRTGVAVPTIRKAHGLLRNALGEAERLELVTRNAARLVRPPSPPPRKVRALEFAEARRLLAVAEGERLYPLVVLAITTGLRRAELLGLRWQDVNLDAGLLGVEQTLLRVSGRLIFAPPKSETSDRTVPVPPTAVGALADHMRRQGEERAAAGRSWQDFGLVFPSTIGTPMEPRNVNRWFDELRLRAGLPWLRLHDLRHAFATFLRRDSGSDLTLIKETMGHSQISITADLYTHVLLPAQIEASATLDTALFGERDEEDPDDDEDDPDDGAAGVLVRR